MLRVLMLDRTEETKKTALVLLEVYFDSKDETLIKRFYFSGVFARISLQAIRETWWLGYANKEMFGNYTAKEFVYKFKNDFEEAYQVNGDKSAITDLYFIGCEVGLIDRGDAFAQQVADGLYKAGFINARVHAVASPPQKNTAMMVKIETGSVYGKTYSGQVRAMLLTLAQEQEYNRLSLCLKQLPQKPDSISVEREIQKQLTAIEEKAIIFLDTLDIKSELDRPHNTFIPNASSRRPVKNLAQEKALCQIEALMRDIAFSKAVAPKLEQQVKKFVAKLKKDKPDDLGKLKVLRNAVANYTDNRWIDYINEAKKKFKEGEPTRKRVDQIFQEASKSIPVSSLVPAAVVTSSSDSFFSQPITVFQRTAGNLAVMAANAFQKTPPEMPREMQGAIARINTLAGRLETEALGAWFTQDLKGYKAKQLRELVTAIKTDFQSQPLTPQWRQLINAAMEDSRLVQGVFSHRVWDLLNEILLTSRPNERTLLLN